jgi:hypothetical protein
MQIGRFTLWCSAERALSYGATHRARVHGVIPGFLNPETGVWIPRSDLLDPVDTVLAYIWVMLRQLRGEEPDFMFLVGEEISPN